MFAFGHGLSYTSFAVTETFIDAGERPGSGPVTVRARLANTGEVFGAEVVQVYLQLPDHTAQPPRRLVEFRKVRLEVDESADVEIVLDPQASHHPLSAWSDGERAFVVPPGTFTVHVGTSSADTREAGTFTVEED